MKIGLSQLVASGIAVEELLPKAAAAGYEVVELALKKEGELTPSTPEPELARIVELSKRHGVEIVSMTQNHLTGSLLESGPQQQKAVEETVVGLRTAAALGARCTLHTLGRLRPDLYYDEGYRNGVAALRTLAKTAEELGVAIAVEFVWSGFLFSPLEMKRFLDEVGSERIGFYFDPGNMAVFQYPHHWARILGAHIKMVHLKDWKGRALNGGWTPLLEGEVDFPAVMRELRAAGYDGPVISEVSPKLASYEQTADAMRRIIQM